MTTKTAILKVIRAHCLECVGDSAVEVKRCTAKSCELYRYRFGKDPSPARGAPKAGFGVVAKNSEVE